MPTPGSDERKEGVLVQGGHRRRRRHPVEPWPLVLADEAGRLATAVDGDHDVTIAAASTRSPQRAHPSWRPLWASGTTTSALSCSPSLLLGWLSGVWGRRSQLVSFRRFSGLAPPCDGAVTSHCDTDSSRVLEERVQPSPIGFSAGRSIFTPFWVTRPRLVAGLPTAEAFPAEGLVLPGPDYLSRVFYDSDRRPSVLRNLGWMFDHGRLGATLEIQSRSCQGPRPALGCGQLSQEPPLFRPGQLGSSWRTQLRSANGGRHPRNPGHRRSAATCGASRSS